ncbi:AHH domain-containing protein [Paracidovorax cattleyae]|uniref:A nuclease family of the HNH/ENDO VII superfamily with conserved AHH n=1 Tax=Paracidovorax cattleyae TaxID=80868 RepID=A0A1H0S7Z4_9BURK|nr:AHH domain-containing protein [Paracidovorax cattleyae]SDP37358.1 A nuclease family of the HNH/ENDO VII superfamily with conserved AHH [Paracidovorax cattleyae]
MADNDPILQSHHVIEQSFFRNHPLIRKLVEHGLIDEHASANRLYLPMDGKLAEELETSPHRGRTRSSYTKGIQQELNRIMDSADGVAALDDDAVALKRVSAKIAEMQDTLKVALVNGDVYATTPDRLTNDEANAQNRRMFSDLDRYRAEHPQQLKTLRAMGAVESEWAAITHSEQRIVAVVEAKQRTSANLVAASSLKDEAVREAAGRAEFRMAIEQAQQSGRLRLNEPSISLVAQVVGDELPVMGRAGSALSTYKPLSQRGFATTEFLAGEHSASQLLRGAGLLASAADTVITARRAGELYSQSNPLAAQSELTHFAGRNLGGWAGGTTAAYALGTSGAGPMVLVAADAYFMTKAGEKLADLYDNRQIYQQTDRDGTHWSFNGYAWSRQGMVDGTNDGASDPVPTSIVASYDKARELNYLATNAAAALALKDAPKPDDPCILPANDSDRPSLSPAPWKRDPTDGQWHRLAKIGVSGENNRGIYAEETALAPRVAELEAEAAAVVARNLANSPAAIAARYELAHHRSGWAAEGWPMSEAVRAALPNPDALTASDGKQYRRDADGQWTHNGVPADSNHALELNTARALLQPALVEHAQDIAASPQSRPSPQDLQREETLYRYRIVGTELRPEWREAIELATQRTREAQGLSRAGALQLQRGPGGVFGADSPIAHLQRGADGVDRIVAVTSIEEIRQALQEVRAHQPAQPSPDMPTSRLAPTARAPDGSADSDGASSNPSSSPQHALDMQAQAQAASTAQQREAREQQERQTGEQQIAQAREHALAQASHEEQVHAVQALEAHATLDHQSQELQQREQQERQVQDQRAQEQRRAQDTQQREAQDAQQREREQRQAETDRQREQEQRPTQNALPREQERRQAEDAVPAREQRQAREAPPLPHGRETALAESVVKPEREQRQAQEVPQRTQALPGGQDRYVQEAAEPLAPSRHPQGAEAFQQTMHEHQAQEGQAQDAHHPAEPAPANAHASISQPTNAQAPPAQHLPSTPASFMHEDAPLRRREASLDAPVQARHAQVADATVDEPPTAERMEGQRAATPSAPLPVAEHGLALASSSGTRGTDQGDRGIEEDATPREQHRDAPADGQDAHTAPAPERAETWEETLQTMRALRIQLEKDLAHEERLEQERHERRGRGDDHPLADLDVRHPQGARASSEQAAFERQAAMAQHDAAPAAARRPGEPGDAPLPQRKEVSGDSDVDDLLHAIYSKNDAAIEQALDRISNSPLTHALLRQGHEHLEAKAMEEAKQQATAMQSLGLDTPTEVQTSRGPVMVMTLPQFASGPMAQGGGGAPGAAGGGGGDGGGGGGGGSGGGGGGGG